MAIGYDKPLYILPFDHRASFEKGLFGLPRRSRRSRPRLSLRARRVVYDGLKLALTQGRAARGRRHSSLTKQFGARYCGTLGPRATSLLALRKKIGQNEFDFEYGEQIRAKHIAEFKTRPSSRPWFRYNPEDDEAMNRRQAARLKLLADYAHEKRPVFSCSSCLVPMTKDQHERMEGDQHLYDCICARR